MGYNIGDGSAGGNSYIIGSLPVLEESAASLARYNQKITYNISNLKAIINEIQSNWENEDGEDIKSVLDNLTTIMKTMSENVQPVIGKYVETLNKLIETTYTIQNTGY